MSRRVLWAGILLGGLAGCAAPLPPRSAISPHPALPQAQGSFYQVQPGDTLWRIAHAFGLTGQTLASVNHLQRGTLLTTGQTLFLPAPSESTRFFWPVRGHLRRVPGSTWTMAHPGIDIGAPEGSFVRASRSGRVAVATRELADLGKTVIIDHTDGYATLYGGMAELLVNPGEDIRQGIPLGRLGRAPLYFEIRYRTKPYDPVKALP